MTWRTPLAATAAATLLAVAACGSSSDDAGEGGWSFTDGRDKTVTLDAEPKKLVVQTSVAAALKDLGVEVPIVFGPLVSSDGSVEAEAGSLDPKKVTDVTGKGEYGDLDLETLPQLKPDLLITYMVVPPQLWYLNEATEKKVEKLVPTLALDFSGGSLTAEFDAIDKLAESLGADLDSDALAADRKAFDDASQRLADVGAKLKKQGKTVLAASATPDLMYAGDPDDFPDLDYYRELGVPFVEPTAGEAGYWEELSWEKADTYDADILLWDRREGDPTLAQFRDNPAFGTTKAGRNKAYIPWNAVTPPSRKAFAKVINELADALEQQL